MIELAANLWQLRLFPRNAFNVYLMGDVLVDAATRYHAGAILRQLRGRKISAHALTHVHPDHQGASREICRALNIPLWCGSAGVSAMESGDLSAQIPRNPATLFFNTFIAGPGHPVARSLNEGDEIAGFRVLAVPGHAPCQLAFWRASDRTLLLGDVLNGINLITGRPTLRLPPARYTTNPAQNIESARRLAALRPRLVCFGHGPPLRNTDKFVTFIEHLKIDR